MALKEGYWFTKTPRGNFWVGLLKAISKEADQLKQNCIFELGDGYRLRFWEDAWCGDNPLSAVLPGLYSLAGTTGAKVADVWEGTIGTGEWNLRFIRPFNDWEMDSVQHFLSLTTSKRILPHKRINPSGKVIRIEIS